MYRECNFVALSCFLYGDLWRVQNWLKKINKLRCSSQTVVFFRIDGLDRFDASNQIKFDFICFAST